MLFRSLCFFLVLSASIPLVAQSSTGGDVPETTLENLVSPEEPDWILPVPIDLNEKSKEEEAAGGTFFLLTDNQYDLGTRTTYYRFLKRFNTESAIQEGSQISTSFDPAYQSLRFHRLIIHRSGEEIDMLASQEFKLIQREEDHERQLYDSSLSAIALLEDTRVGDVVEYAYSITGSNPVFGDHFYWVFSTSYSIPLGEIHAVFRHPSHVTVKFHQNVTDFADIVTTSRSATVHEWHIKEPIVLLSEGGIPGDYSPWGWIEASSFPDWKAVNTWAREQYVIPEVLPENLQHVVEKISRLGSDEEKTLAALRFVQDEIRYLGIFDGVHSHQPYPLETIVRRRFGDCKDKSLLLVALLRELGIDAFPALVESGSRKAIRNWTPSPQAFDHLVTCAIVNGKEVWLDATRSYQRGHLADLFFPDYGYSLVIREDTSDLAEISPQGFDIAKDKITEVFTMKDYLGEATLDVVSIHQGYSADSIRSFFAAEARAEIEQSYLNYYSATYDDIESVAAIQINDDIETNTFTVRESYRIPNIWQELSSDETKFEAAFKSNYTYEHLGKPSTKNRTMPYAVGHPVNVAHEVEIHLPSAMNEKATNIEIEDAAFRFKYRETFDGPVTRLHFSYESLADRVPAERIAEYLKNIRKAEDRTGYTMWIPKDVHEGLASSLPYRINWMFVVIVLGGLGAAVLLLFLGLRLPCRLSEPAFYASRLDGLSGWLVLIGIGVWLRPLYGLIGCWGVVYNNDLDTWEYVTLSGSDGYDALWAPLLIFEAFTTAFALPVYLFALILFHRKHRLFPAVMIAILCGDAAISLLLSMMLGKIPTADLVAKTEYATQFSRAAAGAILWVPYFLISNRVSSTFRSRRQGSPPPLPNTLSGADPSPPDGM